jgi:twitching motility protein PilT
MEDEIHIIEKLVITLISKKGSDLHITAQARNYMRIKKEMIPFPENLLITNADITSWLKEISKKNSNFLKEEDIDLLMNGKKDVDFSFSYNNERLRVHVFCTLGGKLAIAFRNLNSTIPKLEDLKLPSYYKGIADYEQGLVLITGATGSGKSTTIAGLIDLINTMHKKHIITLEQPIEYIFENKLSLIHQKEVGRDVPTFLDGVKSIFREDPDVILVGEIRDKEEMMNALTLASSGHLVFATLHTSGVVHTLGRILSLFESGDSGRIRGLLQDNLRCIVNQSLYKTNSNEVIPLYEHLFINSNTVRILNDDMKDHQIKAILEPLSNSNREMITYRWQSIMKFLQNGSITTEEARRLVELHALDKLKQFELQKSILKE